MRLRPCRGLIRPIAWPVFFLLACLLLPGAASASGYADELAEKAISAGLHERREWHVLLHYRPSALGGIKSLVDDPRFFNSPAGKKDPAEELRATIRAFFRDDVSGDEHPQCRFMGRRGWLASELSIDLSRLPAIECAAFQELHRNIDPRSAALIFPVSHMNSPASMFGHTLLRIDSDKQSNLFSFAVNYSAVTDETNGLFFAFKGIFGLYNGYFGVLPYYEKIKEYSHMENRDIWEYRLDLTRDEVERMLLHLWELKDIYTNYYFFDENCSYNLLLVLEAARPSSDLAGAMPPWVIPMDTVRAVKDAGFGVGSPVYRPSRAARIRHIKGLVDKGQGRLALKVASGKADPAAVASDAGLGRLERARVLDLASEYIQYRYAEGLITKDEFTALYLKVLATRSGQGLIPEYEPARPVPPEQGHGPARASAGVVTKAGDTSIALRFRPANHALMDPDSGYLPGAAITFVEAEGRYSLTRRKPSLEMLTLVDIVSISARDSFFSPISWKAGAGTLREEFGTGEHRTVARVYAGPGLSYLAADGTLVYGFVEPEAKFGAGLDDGYALGAGVRAGAMRQLAPWWKARVELRAASFGPGHSHDILSAGLDQTFSAGKDRAVTLDIKREKFGGYYSTEAALLLNLYF